MFKNYILTGIRNLKRNKIYAVLNILGLALGIGCATVIYKFVDYQLSYDRHQANYENIYRVVGHDIYPDRVDYSMGTPHPVGPALIEDYPELQSVTRMHYIYGGQINVRNEQDMLQKHLLEEGLVLAENSFFDVFTVEWIAGDRENALKEPNTAVISVQMAQQLFGLDRNSANQAIGKILNYDNQVDYRVVGVISDPPPTTNFPFKVYLEYTSQKEINPYYEDGKKWTSTSSNTNTYFLAEKGFDMESFNQKLIGMVEKYLGKEETEEQVFLAQPLSEVHFDVKYGNYVTQVGKEVLFAIALIGVFLIITACINFINLATAQAANRAKEIGIRKAIGGLSSQLVIQFLTEIGFITFIAVLMSLAISELLFINLEEIIGVRLGLNLFSDVTTIYFLLGLFFVVSILSGFYPSVLLSRMNAVMALKSKITAKNHSGGLSLRKGLVIVQFAISQVLIIGTLIISMQMDYFNSKDMGFSKEAIVTSYLPVRDNNKMVRFRQEMLNNSSIKDVTYGLATPLGNNNSYSNFNYSPLQSEDDYHAEFKPIDENYLEFFEIKLLAGRNIRETDSSNVALVNRKIADLMGFSENYEKVMGEKIITGWNGDKQIIGVIENFHSRTLDREMDFQILFYAPQYFYNTSFKIASLNKADEALAHFRSSWEKVYPEYVMDYEFLDKEIAERYDTEKGMASLMKLFSIISIIIGCLGLYGLISFIAQNKIKEIGIRKVLGASIFNILGIFSKEIVILLVIAFIVSAPLAYYFLDQWLSNYVYRISLGLGVFGVALLTTLIIALLTISHRTISAATINPAKTLKDE